MLASEQFEEEVKGSIKASEEKITAFLEENIEDKDQVLRICSALPIVAETVLCVCKKCGIDFDNMPVFTNALSMLLNDGKNFADNSTDLMDEVDVERQRSSKAEEN